MAKTNEECRVKYDGVDYDITEFMHKHPGGTNYLKGYLGDDVKKRMDETNHSKAAKYILRDYKVGGRNEEKIDEKEDLEYLVDWNKAMMPQIRNIGERYYEWVSSPVDREIRYYKSDFAEILTRTPWYAIPILWGPLAMYFLYSGVHTYALTSTDEYHTQVKWMIFHVILGIGAWTLLEYSLHRWFFHMKIDGKSNFLNSLHFTVHGVHHKVPYDPLRLVFPPAGAFIIFLVLYFVFFIFFPTNVSDLIVTGGILGYICYDLIHYYLHHGSPAEGTFFYNLKRYHNHHHFTHSHAGYGISSQFWDVIFGSVIQMKKLSVGIKW